VVALLSQDSLTTDPLTAIVDQMKCVGCFACKEVCPFNAIEEQVTRDNRTISSINESLCKGCGLCVVACRPGAINLRGFTSQQLLSEVLTLVRG
jgi:heterodisulfide reductase subunit A